MSEIKFPLYRKYPHEKTYFKIFDQETFDQLEIIGKRYSLSRFTAKVHPDRVFIQDLIYINGAHWLSIDEKEYEEKLKFCQENLNKLD